jgi:ABC-type bacteriocin/lantibiotic exporter with double-glycine peptidase domain
MQRIYFIILALSITALVLPAIWNVYISAGIHDWRASPRWDGQAYQVSKAGYAPQERDSTGVAAVLATLVSWQGQPTSEVEVHDLFTERDFGYKLSDFAQLAAEYDLDGHWLQAEPGALTRLKTPYIAHLHDGGGRFVIVRDARSGYIYATDPQRGNVLYPLEQFTATWTGQVFAFPEPPAQPEEWR